jgi:hypothetical protein
MQVCFRRNLTVHHGFGEGRPLADVREEQSRSRSRAQNRITGKGVTPRQHSRSAQPSTSLRIGGVAHSARRVAYVRLTL